MYTKKQRFKFNSVHFCIWSTINYVFFYILGLKDFKEEGNFMLITFLLNKVIYFWWRWVPLLRCLAEVLVYNLIINYMIYEEIGIN